MKGCTTFFHLDVASYVQITILKNITPKLEGPIWFV